MKKLFLLVLVALGASQGLHAQSDIEFGYFDNVSVGLSVGSDGIGFDVAAPVKDIAAVRAGFSFVPTVKVNKDIHLSNKNEDADFYKDIDIQGKSKIFDGKILIDLYPFKKSSFHLTAGAFFGGSEVAEVVNTSPILKHEADYGKKGLLLGSGENEYEVSTDKKGDAVIKLKTNGFKPYVGIGFGRAVQKNHRFGVSFDMGVKFWGTPGVYAKAINHNDMFADRDNPNSWKEHHFKFSELGEDDDKDLRDAIETIEKIKVYPVLNLRLTYRIFK